MKPQSTEKNSVVWVYKERDAAKLTSLSPTKRRFYPPVLYITFFYEECQKDIKWK
jgi:hypothetical protein